MKFTDLKSGIVSAGSALVASLCCALPLAIVLLGLGSGAFMMTTMQYRWLFLPIGIAGVSLGYFLYFREKRRCARLACQMSGGRVNLILLMIATVLLIFELALTLAPNLSASLLAKVMAENAMGPMPGEMSSMASHQTMTPPPVQPTALKSPATPPVQVADASSIVLKIDGMS